MGTSVKKTSRIVKRLLEQSRGLNEQEEIEKIIPNICTEVIKSKKTRKYFEDNDFIVLANSGFSYFKKIKTEGFDKALEEYNVKLEKIEDDKLSAIQVQKVIESILDKVEDDNKEIESSFILGAFQVAMTKMLLNNFNEPEQFLTLFCETFISKIITEEANEEIIEEFKEISINEISNNISEFSRLYVEENFKDIILQCCNNETNLENLIDEMKVKLNFKEEL